MKKLLREPFIHFLLIGCVLLALNAWIGAAYGPAAKRIVVSPNQVEQLASEFSRTWLRPPTEAEMTGLINEYVRDEVYHREALALGLDRNDRVVRRRLRQKLEIILDDMASVSVPSDQVLTVFMQEHADKFRLEPRVSFRHIYLNPDQRQDMEADGRTMLADLSAGATPETLGDPTLMELEYTLTTQSEIAGRFGEAFARQVVELEPGAWSGPLDPGLGGHLVMVSERRKGRFPELAEIRSEVEREWLALRRNELKDAAYHKLVEGYEVIIERTEGAE